MMTKSKELLVVERIKKTNNRRTTSKNKKECLFRKGNTGKVRQRGREEWEMIMRGREKSEITRSKRA